MPVARWGVHLGSYASWEACRCEYGLAMVAGWVSASLPPCGRIREVPSGRSAGRRLVMSLCELVVCHSPAGRRLYRRSPRLDWALPPSHGGGGVTAGLGAGRVTGMTLAEWSDPQTTTPTHHTHLKEPGHRVVPPRWRCRRAAPGAWWPHQCPCACRRRGQGMGQGGATSPWRAVQHATRNAPELSVPLCW